MRTAHGRDDRQSKRRSASENTSHNATGLPRHTDAMVFFPSGPEEVEKEGSAEDEGREDAGENVETGHAHVVVVVDFCVRIERLDPVLFVDVV